MAIYIPADVVSSHILSKLEPSDIQQLLKRCMNEHDIEFFKDYILCAYMHGNRDIDNVDHRKLETDIVKHAIQRLPYTDLMMFLNRIDFPHEDTAMNAVEMKELWDSVVIKHDARLYEIIHEKYRCLRPNLQYVLDVIDRRDKVMTKYILEWIRLNEQFRIDLYNIYIQYVVEVCNNTDDALYVQDDIFQTLYNISSRMENDTWMCKQMCSFHKALNVKNIANIKQSMSKYVQRVRRIDGLEEDPCITWRFCIANPDAPWDY